MAEEAEMVVTQVTLVRAHGLAAVAKVAMAVVVPAQASVPVALMVVPVAAADPQTLIQTGKPTMAPVVVKVILVELLSQWARSMLRRHTTLMWMPMAAVKAQVVAVAAVQATVI